MRPALLPPTLLLLLLALASGRRARHPPGDDTSIQQNNTTTTHDGVIDAPITNTDTLAIQDDANNRTIIQDDANNRTIIQDDATNGTLAETDEDHEPIVRKKRTFGDIVFRGLADVLGYQVARKPPQSAFPPPLAPRARWARRPAGRSCRPRRRGPRPAPNPARRSPPPPPPPPAPPCPNPRANAPAACAPAPPPKDNLETISSNFRLDFNFVRSTPAPAGAVAQVADVAQPQQQQELAPVAPVALQPRAAKLPLEAPRNPRVYVDAFVVRNGVAQRVNTVDAKHLNPQQAQASLEEDYLAYDEEAQSPEDEEDYEDAQESRDRAKAVKDFGAAVDNFWENKQRQGQRQRAPPPPPPPPPRRKQPPQQDYRNVHFGDRNLVNQIRRTDIRDSHQSLQRDRLNPNRIPVPAPVQPDEDEVTTTTQDPRRPLRPRVLPPTEQHPNQIDTVTVRVPPIYREKRPRKLHRDVPDRDEDGPASEEVREESGERQYYYRDRDRDADGEDSSLTPRTEQPVKRKRRRRLRKTRSTDEGDYTAGDYDYYGKKLPITKEEEYYRSLTVSADDDKNAKQVKEPDEKKYDYYLDDHERLVEDPEREDESERLDDSGRTDDSGKFESLTDGMTDDSGKFESLTDGRTDDSGKLAEDVERFPDKENLEDDPYRLRDDRERADERERANEEERTDRLSPNAQVHETGYSNNYVRAHNVQVDDPRPAVGALTKQSAAIGKAR
ncbi:hypothetical protein ACJJTC_000176 [Scirpophaga incertulas]